MDTEEDARLTVPHVRSALAGTDPWRASASTTDRNAAVAIILHPGPAGLEVLLIRRATRAEDPWSGQMGLPGGRNEPADASLTDTAIRETREETGVDLTQAELLGCLDPVPAQARGRRVALVIRPFVFALSETQPIGTSDEVDEALWCPLAPLYSGAWATTFKYEFDSHTLTLPAWNVGGRVVWGLTHAMLEMFARKLGIQPQRG